MPRAKEHRAARQRFTGCKNNSLQQAVRSFGARNFFLAHLDSRQQPGTPQASERGTPTGKESSAQ